MADLVDAGVQDVGALGGAPVPAPVLVVLAFAPVAASASVSVPVLALVAPAFASASVPVPAPAPVMPVVGWQVTVDALGGACWAVPTPAQPAQRRASRAGRQPTWARQSCQQQQRQ